MHRIVLPIFALVLSATLAVAAGSACGGGDAQAADDEPGGGSARRREAGATKIDPTKLTGTAVSPDEAAERERQAAIDRDFPKHGLIKGVQLVVRDRPDPAGVTIGWLRIGSRIRLKSEPEARTGTCSSGWYAIYPIGYACAGEGIEIGDTPPQNAFAITPAARDAPLPYQYWFVKEPLVPEYHQLPSRDQQREARDWIARYLEIVGDGTSEPALRRAQRFRAGELGPESAKPAIVNRWLDRGFFVAGADVEVRAFRRFVRTVRGRYLKEAQLEPRRGSSFHGVDLGVAGADGVTRQLPIAWAVRAARPMTRQDRADGTVRFVENAEAPAIERLSLVEWSRRERAPDGRVMHVLADGSFVRDWFLAVAERVDPPRGIAGDEPWVHVDISQQTLVLYRGRDPVYATLVSSGLEGHDSPIGEFTIRQKHVAETMSAIGPDVSQDERYAIEDVPWTQYFSGSIALHGAFWHERFGLRRSHGCINLAPADAHRLFLETWPEVPEGWHGVSTDRSGLRGSRVVITE